MNDKVVLDNENVKEPTGYFRGTVKPGSEVVIGITKYYVDQNGNLVRQSLKNSKKRMHKSIANHNRASNDSQARRAEEKYRVATDKMFKDLAAREERALKNVQEVLHPRVHTPVLRKIYTPEELKAKALADAISKAQAEAERARLLKAKKKNRRKMAKISRKANRG